MDLLEIQNVSKTYGRGEAAVHALKQTALSVPKGEFVAIVGGSGSGESILLNMIDASDTSTPGKVLINDRDILSMRDNSSVVFRRRDIGFIFQNSNLTPELTVEQNIIFPALSNHEESNKKYLEGLFAVLNLKECHHHLPSQLSGGQWQRAAIERTLITRPALIPADESTGNLDSQSTSEVITLLKGASRECEQIIVMIIHSRSIVQAADRILQVSDGAVLDLGRCRE